MNGQYSTDANLRGRFIVAHIVVHAMSVGSFYKFLPFFFVNLGGRSLYYGEVIIVSKPA